MNEMVMVRIGYLDRVAGRGFAPDYERWDSVAQVAYEEGRLVACDILAAGEEAPAWGTSICVAWEAMRAIEEAEKNA